MVNYREYNEARVNLNQMIIDREKDITDIEDEIRQLKKVRRMMDDEFKSKMGEKEEFVG